MSIKKLKDLIIEAGHKTLQDFLCALGKPNTSTCSEQTIVFVPATTLEADFIPVIFSANLQEDILVADIQILNLEANLDEDNIKTDIIQQTITGDIKCL